LVEVKLRADAEDEELETPAEDDVGAPAPLPKNDGIEALATAVDKSELLFATPRPDETVWDGEVLLPDELKLDEPLRAADDVVGDGVGEDKEPGAPAEYDADVGVPTGGASVPFPDVKVDVDVALATAGGRTELLFKPTEDGGAGCGEELLIADELNPELPLDGNDAGGTTAGGGGGVGDGEGRGGGGREGALAFTVAVLPLPTLAPGFNATLQTSSSRTRGSPLGPVSGVSVITQFSVTGPSGLQTTIRDTT
jgi:hypothetical protein